MTFPSNPNDNDIHTAFGRRLKYKGSTSTWEVVSSPSVAIETEAPVANTAVSSSSDLPLTGNEIGAMSYSQDTNTLYVWNGTGWFKIALVNTNPSISGGVESTYAILPGGDPITVTVAASDPEGVPLTWSHTITSGTVEDTTVSNDGSIFTIVPGATPATFNIVFTASDGVNIDTSSSLFTISIPFTYAGDQYGFSVGGGYASYNSTAIGQHSYASDGDEVSLGTASLSALTTAGAKSMTHGYVTGGNRPPFPPYGPKNWMDKFEFANGTLSTNIGTLTIASYYAVGLSSDGYGYHAGGSNTNFIDRYPTSSDTNATNIGSLSTGWRSQGLTSVSDVSGGFGYMAGGYGQTYPTDPGGRTNIIDRFPFASGGVATDCGDLLKKTYNGAGSQSDTYGYHFNGSIESPTETYASTVIKWAFASSVSNVSIPNGTLQGREQGGTSTSTTSAYIFGDNRGYTSARWLHKWVFASDTQSATVSACADLRGAPASGIQL
jgi:hypothetical protein